MCHYTHFSTEERELSRVLKAQGLSIRAIARMLNRSPSSVSREFRRNSYSNGTHMRHITQTSFIKNVGKTAAESQNSKPVLLVIMCLKKWLCGGLLNR